MAVLTEQDEMRRKGSGSRKLTGVRAGVPSTERDALTPPRSGLILKALFSFQKVTALIQKTHLVVKPFSASINNSSNSRLTSTCDLCPNSYYTLCQHRKVLLFLPCAGVNRGFSQVAQASLELLLELSPLATPASKQANYRCVSLHLTQLLGLF